jgi:hypothetical protein
MDGWYGLEALFHDKHVETASFCSREDGTTILGGRLPSPATGKPEEFLIMYPPEVADNIGGGMLHPVGEV